MIRVHARPRRLKDRSISWQMCWVDPNDSRERRLATGVRTSPRPGVRERRATRADAVRIASAMQMRLNDEYEPGRTIQMPIRFAAERYAQWLLAPAEGGEQRRAGGTVTNVRRHLREFVGWMETQGHRPDRFWMKLVSQKHVAAWRDTLYGRSLKGSTVNVMLASLAGWFKWARQFEYTKKRPMHELQRPRPRRPEVTTDLADPYLMRAALKKLLRRLRVESEVRAAVVELLAVTGLRQGPEEFRGLRREDVDLIDRLLIVRSNGRETTKRHARRIPLCRQGIDAVGMLLGNGHGPYLIGVSDGTKPLTSHLNKWLKPHGYTPHDLRRFFNTALETLGAPQRVIDDLMAHSPGRVRGAYSPTENLIAAREWIGRLEAWLEVAQV